MLTIIDAFALFWGGIELESPFTLGDPVLACNLQGAPTPVTSDA